MPTNKKSPIQGHLCGQEEINKQNFTVCPLEYFTSDYCHPVRFASFSYQLQEVFACKAKKVLEIGIGNSLVSYLLRRASIRVDTVDHDPKLLPDIVASVLALH